MKPLNNMKRNLIKLPLIIIIIISPIYIISTYILENYFNLLLRDWVSTLFSVVLVLCAFFIEIGILIKLNGILENASIKKLWKGIIRIVSICVLILANFYVFFLYLFVIGGSYEEIGVETYDGEKYVVRDIAPWIKADSLYNYHLYKNPFVYHANVFYSGEVKLGDVSNISPVIPEKIDENNNEDIEIEIENIEDEEEIYINSDHIEYIQKVDDNINYGFYLIDRAGHQYLYGFVKSVDGGNSWEIIYKFPSNSEIYYCRFLDKEIGFANFGSEDELSLFMTRDSGLSWDKVSINIGEENKGMVYVQNVEKVGGKIELTLGFPSWTGSNRSVKYYSVDRGLTWKLGK